MTFFERLLKYRWWFILLIFSGLAVFYTVFNPYTDNFFPKCVFYKYTGYQCPGCGSQRTIYNLLHFHFYDAVKENLLLVLSIPYLILLAYFDIFPPKTKKLVKVRDNFFGLISVWIIFFLILFYWVIRNTTFYHNLF